MKRERERERRGTDFSIDWLTSTRRQLDKLAVRIQSERFQIERGREWSCRVPLCHNPQLRPKNRFGSDSVSSFFPPSNLACSVSPQHVPSKRIFRARVSSPPLRRRWQTYMGHHHEERRARVVLSGWKEVSPLCFLSLRLLIIPERREKKIVFLCEYQANMGFPWIYNLLRQFFFLTVHNVKVWDSDSLSVRGSLLWGTFHNRGHKVILT